MTVWKLDYGGAYGREMGPPHPPSLFTGIPRVSSGYGAGQCGNGGRRFNVKGVTITMQTDG